MNSPKGHRDLAVGIVDFDVPTAVGKDEARVTVMKHERYSY